MSICFYQSITLTTGTDLPSLTSGNDTVTGAAGTLGADDIVVDASATDSDVANLTIGADLSANQTVFSKVETMNLTFGFTGQFDAEKVTGTTTMNVSGSTGVTTVANLEGVSGTDVVVNSGISTLNLEGRAATTDTATVTVNGNLTLKNDGVAIETLTVKNAAATAATVTAYNAGGGDLVVGTTQVINLQGNDLTVKVDQADVTGQTVNETMNSGKAAVLTVYGTNADADFSKVDTDIVINMADDGTDGNLIQLATNAQLRLSATWVNTTGTATTAIAGKTGTTNTVNLQSNAATHTLINLDGMSTVNLSALVDTTIGNLEALTTTTVNVSGAKNVVLSAATASAVNATSLTGNLTATLHATNLKNVTGGTGVDTINAVDGDFTVNGGDGTDTLAFAGTTDLSNNAVSLTGIEVIKLDSSAAGTETVTMLSSVVTGKTFVLLSGDGTNDDTLSVKGNGTSIDLGNVTVDTGTAMVTINLTDVAAVATTIVGSSGADTLSNAGAGIITIDGKAGNDVLSAGSSADNITGGEGTDVITGANGADVIVLTESVAASDSLVYTLTETGGADRITGFKAGATNGDMINVDAFALQDGDGTAGDVNTAGGGTDQLTATSDVAVAATIAALTSGTAGVYIFTTDIGGTIDFTTATDTEIATAVETALEHTSANVLSGTATSAVTNGGVGADVLLGLFDGTNTVLVKYAEGGTAEADFSGELTVIGVLNGTAASGLTHDNFFG